MNNLATTNVQSISDFDVALKEFKAISIGEATIKRYGFISTLNKFDSETAIKLIKQTALELHNEEQFQALNCFVDKLKKGIKASNDGTGTRAKFLDPHGGTVEIPLAWQRQPKVCLGLKDPATPIRVNLWTISKSEQESLKVDKERLKNKEKGAQRAWEDVKNEERAEDPRYLAEHFYKKLGYSKARQMLEHMSELLNTNHRLVMMALKGEVTPLEGVGKPKRTAKKPKATGKNSKAS